MRISLPQTERTNAVDTAEDSLYTDTLVIRNVDGRDMIVMKTMVDDNGEAVASQVLKAAKVTARFRNVAERHGKVDISFQITVPQTLQQKNWQLRYTPILYMMSDSSLLDKVIVTGREYRRRQLRGYQQYNRFLDRIIGNEEYFVDRHTLEIFIRRNMPGVYAMRCDSSFVSDEQFESLFGITEDEAMDHYTNHLAKRCNEQRKQRKAAMFRKYVKVPLAAEGVRIDTTIDPTGGDMVIDYTQRITTRPGLKRVDIALDGEIYEQEKKVYTIGRSDKLNYYISSLSFFVDDSPRYITRIIERQARADMSYNLDFKSGSSELVAGFGDNGSKISEIQNNLKALYCNDVFELDSICVLAGASPEGAFKMNMNLSRNRSKSICKYFNSYLKAYSDSLRRTEPVTITVDSLGRSVISASAVKRAEIPFLPQYLGEDWAGLDSLINRDSHMEEEAKIQYSRLREIKDPDARERSMAGMKWYAYARKELYPALRSVNFRFFMHRKGMIKDTVHTTVIDSAYMRGVQAIKDRDFKKAIEILRPYNDYNTAVAYCAADYNHSAMAILSHCSDSPKVNYMKALLYSRLGAPAKAIEYYLRSCSQDPSLIHRGNLDPEINTLTKQYNINP